MDHKRTEFVDKQSCNWTSPVFVLRSFVHKRFHSLDLPLLLKAVKSLLKFYLFGYSLLKNPQKLRTISSVKPHIQLLLVLIINYFVLSIHSPIIPYCSYLRIILPVIYKLIMIIHCMFILSLKSLESLHLFPFLFCPFFYRCVEIDQPPCLETKCKVISILFSVDSI